MMITNNLKYGGVLDTLPTPSVSDYVQFYYKDCIKYNPNIAVGYKLCNSLPVKVLINFITGTPDNALLPLWQKTVDLLPKIQNASDKKLKNQLKSELPIFSNVDSRKTEYVNGYNGCVWIDIDGQDNPGLNTNEIQQKLIDCIGQNSFVIAKSPSGNGVKALLFTELDTQKFTLYITPILDFVATRTGLNVDFSGTDITRVCYAMIDKSGFVNHNPIPFNTAQLNPTQTKPSNRQKPNKPAKVAAIKDWKNCILTSKDYYLLNLVKDTIIPAYNAKNPNRIIEFVDGKKHDFIKFFAINARKIGVKSTKICKYIDETYFSGCIDKQTIDIVKWVNKNVLSQILEEDRQYIDFNIIALNVDKYISETETSKTKFVNSVFDNINNGAILIKAPTGTGKTRTVKDICNRFTENGGVQIIIALPNCNIVQETAKNMGVPCLHEEIKGEARNEAYRSNIVVATYSQTPALIEHAIKGKLVKANDLLVIVDEQHSYTEGFRNKDMHKMVKATEGLVNVIYLSATPSEATVLKDLGVKTIINVDVKERIPKDLYIHKTVSINHITTHIKTLLDNGKYIGVYYNNSDDIKRIINTLVEEGYSSDCFGVIAADRTIKTAGLDIYCIKEQLLQNGLLPGNIKVLFFTKALEYGFSINNDNFTDLIIVDERNKDLNVSQLVQIPARFRAGKRLAVHLFVGKEQPYDNQGLKRANLEYNRVLQKVELDVKLLNEIVEDWEEQHNEPYEPHKEQFVAPLEGVTFNKETHRYEVVKTYLASVKEALIAKYAGYMDKVEDIVNIDNSFVFTGNVYDYTNHGKKVAITETSTGNKLDINSIKVGDSDMISKADAKNRVTEILIEESQINTNIIEDLKAIGIVHYKIRANGYTETDDYGNKYTKYPTELSHKQNELYQKLEEDRCFSRGSGRSLVGYLFMLEYLGLDSKILLALVTAILGNNYAKKALYFVLNERAYTVGGLFNNNGYIDARRAKIELELKVYGNLEKLIETSKNNPISADDVFKIVTGDLIDKQNYFHPVELVKSINAFLTENKLVRNKKGKFFRYTKVYKVDDIMKIIMANSCIVEMGFDAITASKIIIKAIEDKVIDCSFENTKHLNTFVDMDDNSDTLPF